MSTLRVLLSLDGIAWAIAVMGEGSRLEPKVKDFRLDIARALYDMGCHDET